MIDISTRKPNLSVRITCIGDNRSFFQKLVILFSSSECDVNLERLTITLQWSDFQRLLDGFLYLCREHYQEICIDDFTKVLLQNFAEVQAFRKGKKEFVSLTNEILSEILLVEGFNRKLTEQQSRDAVRLLSLRQGANFSVPGAGKTTTLLAVSTVLRHKQMVSKLFVVSPKNAFISWEDEVADIFSSSKIPFRLSDLSVKTISQAFDQHDIILINYEKLRREINTLLPFFFAEKVHFVLDESHRIKSGCSNLSFAQIDRLTDVAVRRDILSGTPLPQSYLDLDPQFYFLWRSNKILPTDLSDQNEDTSARVNSSIKKYFVRTTKDELGLPVPLIHYEKIEMGPIQSEIYQLLRSEAKRRFSKLSRSDANYLRQIGSSTVRLMQAATNPMLLGDKDEYFHETLDPSLSTTFWDLFYEYSKYEKPTKLTFLQSYVKNYLDLSESNKVVIWTYFIRNIKLLEKILKSFNPTSIYGAIATGDVSDQSTREGRIRKFHNDSECRVLIANPQACGEGINLHRASHHAVYLDRNFNAAYYLQSVDRIHRLGLSSDVKTEITLLTSVNTVDEVILNRLNEKTLRMAQVLNDHSLKRLALDPEDISLNDSLGLDATDLRDIFEHLNQED